MQIPASGFHWEMTVLWGQVFAITTESKKVTLLNENNEAVDKDGRAVPAGQNIVKAADLSGSHYRLH